MAERDVPGILAPPPLIYAAGFGAGKLIERWFPHPVMPAAWTRPLAIVLCILGLMGIVAIHAFRRADTSPNPYRPASQLVTGGIYRLSRNPMYVGFTLFYLSGACWDNSLWPFLFLPIVLLVMLYGVILREERYLERRFGDAYRQYMGQVRRWL